MNDPKSQLRASLANALGSAPRWVLQALAEGNMPMRSGACEEIVNRLIRGIEPYDVVPKRVCPYTGTSSLCAATSPNYRSASTP